MIRGVNTNTVQEYLKTIPADRIEAFEKLRNVILESLPKGLEETMSYGMIGWFLMLFTRVAIIVSLNHHFLL